MYIVFKQVIGLLLAADSSPSLFNMTVLPPVEPVGDCNLSMMSCSRTLPSNSCMLPKPLIDPIIANFIFSRGAPISTSLHFICHHFLGYFGLLG